MKRGIMISLFTSFCLWSLFAHGVIAAAASIRASSTDKTTILVSTEPTSTTATTTTSTSHRLTQERYLALTDSIVCAANKPPGDFCGAVLNKVYTLEDAANFTGSTLFSLASNRTATYQVSEYVVKYKTQVRNGTVIDATGVVWLPRGVDIPGGHPVVLFGHGTVGSNDEDAPSATLMNPNYFVGLEMSLMRNFAATGSMVVIPDYAGLGVAGTPGFYLVKKPTAYSVIDGVRSSLIFAKKQGLVVSRNTAFIGHSQGGSAVLQALEIYDGPEAYGKTSFDVKVVVPTAPAPVWRYSFYSGYKTNFNSFVGTIFASYLYAASSFNKNLDLSLLLTPLGVNVTNTYVPSVPVSYMLANNVFPSNSTEFFTPGTIAATGYNLNAFLCYVGSPYCQGGLPPLTLSDFTLSPIPADWQAQMDEDSPGYTLVSSVPVRLLQGTADSTVNPYFTIPLAQKLAMNGVVLVDKAGLPIILNAPSIASELGKISNCTSPGLFLQCGLSHAGILSAMDQYVPLVLSKLELPVLTKSCLDDSSFYLNENPKRTCSWISGKTKRKTRWCNSLKKKHNGTAVPVYSICQSACGFCA